MVKLPSEVTTWTWGEAAGVAVLSAFAAAAGEVSAAKLGLKKAIDINPAMSTSCFMLRDSTRMGTILRYVLHRHTRRYEVCTQSHRLLASGQRANGLFQPPMGPQKRRPLHFAHRGH